jgi:hypothetical protein
VDLICRSTESVNWQGYLLFAVSLMGKARRNCGFACTVSRSLVGVERLGEEEDRWLGLCQ